MKVKKRNNSIVEFDSEKIYRAIMKAAISCGITDFHEEASDITINIEWLLQEDICDEPIDIEVIQDLVEIELINTDSELGKAYILFRDSRRKEREKNEYFANIIRRRALNPEDANQRGNANLDEESFSGRQFEASEELWKEIALSDFMPQDIADLYKSGQLYLHDLSRFALGQPNCLCVNLAELLKNGFITRNITLRSPSRFSSACQQVAVIFQVLSQAQFGGISSGHIDRDLAPYVRKSKDKIIDKYQHLHSINEQMFYSMVEEELENELKQGAEALVHNLASLQSRPGQQLPFSSLNLGADPSYEGRLVCKAILQAMINGVGPNRTTPPFPILCFQLKDSINMKPEDPNYDLKLLAIECATKRLTPTFVNCDSSICNSTDDPDTWHTSMGKW